MVANTIFRDSAQRMVQRFDSYLTSSLKGLQAHLNPNSVPECREPGVVDLEKNAGILLQIDDAWLPALWDRIGIEMGLEAFQRRCQIRIEALNHALRGIPEDRVRYHLCWGSWHGPHVYDLELKHLAKLLLSLKAQAYLIEAANARHEHE